LRAEIALDKERRKANKGVLPSVLGVDGYNPSIVQYSADTSKTTPQPGESSTAAPSTSKPAPAPTASVSKVEPSKPKPTSKATSSTSESSQSPEVVIDTAIGTISRYRTGGDGGNAFGLLLTFLRNIVDHPEETK
jgi:hypothetical protein